MKRFFFWHLKSGACFSKVSKNSKISNLMINELFFHLFILNKKKFPSNKNFQAYTPSVFKHKLRNVYGAFEKRPISL